MLLDREHELATLVRILDQVGIEGATVTVSGAPGSGKTSLVGWALAAARERGMRVLAARGAEDELETPLGIVRQLVARPSELDLIAPRSSFDPGYLTLRALHCVFVDLAERSPLLVVIDDAQWADVPSLRYVGFLSRRVRALPVVLVIASTRSEAAQTGEAIARITGAPDTTALQLGPLSPQSTTALVRARGWPDASDHVCEACHAVTAGNPFLLVSLVNELGGGAGDAGPPTVEQVGAAAPAAVLEKLRGRLAGLPPDAAPLASAVALLGDRAELGTAAALASIDEATAREAADALVRAEIFSPGAPLSFGQQITRSAICSELSPETLRDANARAARVLRALHSPADRIAAHVLDAGPLGETWVLDTLRQAARDALTDGSPHRAATLLRRALDERLDPVQRVEVLRELGVAEARVSMPRAIERFRQALDLIPAAGPAQQPRTEILRLLSSSLLASGHELEAIASLDAALAELGDGESELKLVLEAERAASAELHADRAVAARDRLDRTWRLFGGRDGAAAEHHLMAVFADRMLQSPAPAKEPAELAARSLAGEHLLADEASSVTLFVAGTVLDLAGRSRDAEQLFGEVLLRGSLAGSLVAHPLAYVGRATARLHCGALDAALADAREALELSPGRGRKVTVGEAGLACLIHVAIEQEDLELCEDELERRWPIGQLPNTAFANQLLLARGCLHLAQGRPSDAVADLDSVRRRLERWGAPIKYEWRNPAALAHQQMGDQIRASALARESLELATAWGAPRQLAAALQTIGLIEGGTRRTQRLRTALQVLDGSGARLERARALVNLGASLCGSGHPSEGCRFLHAGRELAFRCGALRVVRAAEKALALAGVRTDQRSFGERWRTLTPRELRVAKMAANGLSNPEIAATLFVSRKTVEMHLGNAYRKLGISARERLATVLEPGQ